MPFFLSDTKIINTSDCVSLQVQKPLSKRTTNILFSHNGLTRKRACPFASGGSITLEAAIVLTVFLSVALFMESYLVMMHTELSVQIHMNEIAQDAAQNLYYLKLTDTVTDHSETMLSLKNKIKEKMGLEKAGNHTKATNAEKDSVAKQNIGDATNKETTQENRLAKGITVGYLSLRLMGALDGDAINAHTVLGGRAGIHVLDSTIEDGMVDMVVQYRYRIPYVNQYLRICQRSRVKDWIGVDITQTQQTVYITKDSEVYHTTMDCRHLALHIRRVLYGELMTLRNQSGHKYSACNYCVRESLTAESSILITEDGTKFHTSLQCQGLKRSVTAVDISQVGDKRPCSTCGKGE